MERLDNTWNIDEMIAGTRSVHINGERYQMGDKDAAICHAILLLVDSIKELSAEVDGIRYNMS